LVKSRLPFHDLGYLLELFESLRPTEIEGLSLGETIKPCLQSPIDHDSQSNNIQRVGILTTLLDVFKEVNR
jgi:hypothetical protein